MKKSMIMFAVATLIGFTACEKENEINAPNTSKNDMLVFDGYTIQDGYLKFDSQESYDKKLDELYSANPEQVKQWRKQLPFKTLEDKYQEENIPEYIYKDAVSEFPTSERNTQRLCRINASLFNEHGIVVIGEKIIKIKGEYQYEIENGDFSFITDIENEKEIDSNFVKKEKHTILLKPQNESKLKIKDRTFVFYIAKKERVFAEFEGSIVQNYITFEMRGQYQEKTWHGWPLFPDNYYMSWGSISVKGVWGSEPIDFVGERLYNVLSVWFRRPKLPYWSLTATFYYKVTDKEAYIGEFQGDGKRNSTEGSYTMYYES